MRYIHGGFQHPNGGVSPMKQEDVFLDPNRPVSEQVEEKKEKKIVKKKVVEKYPGIDKEVVGKNKQGTTFTYSDFEKIDGVWRNKKNPRDKVASGYIKALDKVEEGYGVKESGSMSLGDKIDLTLSVGGMAPGVGIGADIVNVVQNTGQALYNAVTGDFPEAKKDAKNALWAAGAIVPFGLGQWFTGMKLAKNTAKLTKSGSKVTADFINNATEAEIKSSKLLTNAEKVEIINAKVNAKLAKTAANGGVVNGKKYYKGATHYGKIARKDFHGVTKDIFGGVRQTGKVTDDALAKMNWNAATDLRPDHVKRIGTQGTVTLKDGRKVPRGIYEVSYPDGTKQRFWRSTSGGGKTVKLADGSVVSSEGFFGTVAGHMDAPPGVLGKPGSKSFKEGVDGWFVKGDDWMGYGSKTYKETGALLKEFFESGLIN